MIVVELDALVLHSELDNSSYKIYGTNLFDKGDKYQINKYRVIYETDGVITDMNHCTPREVKPKVWGNFANIDTVIFDLINDPVEKEKHVETMKAEKSKPFGHEVWDKRNDAINARFPGTNVSICCFETFETKKLTDEDVVIDCDDKSRYFIIRKKEANDGIHHKDELTIHFCEL